MTSAHLTDAQLYELLDTPSEVRHRHLATCPSCQRELALIGESLDNFRLAAVQISLAHDPVRRPLAEPDRARFSLPRIAWATGVATILITATAELSLGHPAAATHHAVVTSQRPAADAAGPDDEALLKGIDNDLSNSVPTSLQPLSVRAVADETSTGNGN